MSGFLSQFVTRYNAASEGQQLSARGDLFQVGAQVGQGILGLTAGSAGKDAQEASARVRGLTTEINARRTARELRYSQGLAKVQNASLGNGQFGSMLAVFADDERKSRERIEDVFLQNEFAKINDKYSQPSGSEKALGFLGSLASAGNGLSSIFAGLNNG